jgi:DNA-directed RNA polymerase beta' subunit
MTIQLHLAVTPAHNLDFDGDELNLFTLGSYPAMAEAQELMSVGKNMFKDGNLLVGFVQHSVLGAYKLTEFTDRPVFTYSEACPCCTKAMTTMDFRSA